MTKRLEKYTRFTRKVDRLFHNLDFATRKRRDQMNRAAFYNAVHAVIDHPDDKEFQEIAVADYNRFTGDNQTVQSLRDWYDNEF